MASASSSSSKAKTNAKLPFYIQITNVKEDYINDQQKPSSVDLPLVTLPAGTVLFRGLKIPDARKGEDIRYFYRDFLGNPEGSENVCLSPIQNVFFYPFPYVAFGANAVGKTFTMMQMVVLVHPITVVACISPSPFVRGKGLAYSGSAPWQRCNNFSGSDYDCHTQSEREAKEKGWDNCLSPEYQVRSGTRGWMAVAKLDSINILDKAFGKKTTTTTTTMGTFLRSLNGQIPGEGKAALAWAYVDDNRTGGFPEIAMYPYRIHKGRHLITRYCPNEKAAIRLLEKEAANDNLNYLPIAAFTKNGVIDMVSGYFSYDRLGVTENAFDVVSAQQVILKNVHTFMERAQTEGLTLPHYGSAKIVFDSRTGFFALDKVVSPTLMIQDVPYRSLLFSLEGEEAQKRALKYMLILRNFMPEHFMERYAVDPKFVVRRAMIFNRFPVLTELFTGTQLNMPRNYLGPLERAGYLYKRETAKVKKNKPMAPMPPRGPMPPMPMQIKSPSYLNKPFPTYSGPITPPYEANEPLPEYGSITPPYEGANAPPYEGAKAPPYEDSGSKAPPYEDSGSKAPPYEGSKTPVEQTGGSNQDSARQYASLFAGVWNNYSTNKK